MLSPVVAAIEAAPLADLPAARWPAMPTCSCARCLHAAQGRDPADHRRGRASRNSPNSTTLVIARVTPAMRALMTRAVARGELPSDALARFPQLDRAGAGRGGVEFAVRALCAARCARAAARPYRPAVRPQERAMSCRDRRLARSLSAGCGRPARRLRQRQAARVSGLGRGRPHLRRPRRGRAGRDADRARRQRGDGALLFDLDPELQAADVHTAAAQVAEAARLARLGSAQQRREEVAVLRRRRSAPSPPSRCRPPSSNASAIVQPRRHRLASPARHRQGQCRPRPRRPRRGAPPDHRRPHVLARGGHRRRAPVARRRSAPRCFENKARAPRWPPRSPARCSRSITGPARW